MMKSKKKSVTIDYSWELHNPTIIIQFNHLISKSKHRDLSNK